MSTVIAERVLEPDHLVLRVYLPEQHEASGDWVCRVTVGDHSLSAWGVDQLQALLMGLVALEARVQESHRTVSFCGMATGGLPRLVWSQ